MKILFILGNGFDLNVGLKTGYHSFYEYYIKQPSPAECVERMKNAIKYGKDATWADLEEGLGEFSSTCTREDFLKCLSDIRMELRKYLHSETDDKNYAGLKLDDIIHPEAYLEPQQLRNYNFLMTGRMPSKNKVDVISLNYTLTLEDILRLGLVENGHIFNEFLKNDYVLGQVVHLHGLLDNELNLGVNDVTQIKNNSIIDRDVIEEFVKPEYNEAAMNINNELATDLISEADSIVIFGSSLGVTDRKWWKLIGQNVEKRGCGLIYFVRGKSKDDSATPNFRRRWIREIMDIVKQRLELPQDVEVYTKRICIGINKPIFSSIELIK